MRPTRASISAIGTTRASSRRDRLDAPGINTNPQRRDVVDVITKILASSKDTEPDQTPQPQPEPKPYPWPWPGGPCITPVDPVCVAAELELRLAVQGCVVGPRYNRAAAVNAVRSLLAAMDIPQLPVPTKVAVAA